MGWGPRGPVICDNCENRDDRSGFFELQMDAEWRDGISTLGGLKDANFLIMTALEGEQTTNIRITNPTPNSMCLSHYEYS